MNFNWKIYKELNVDLHDKLKNKQEYEKHYEDHGKKENRKASILHVYSDFNSKNYRHNYDDLSNLTEEDLEYHYVKYGKNENRIYNRKIYRVYIISNIEAGGSVKYIKDLMDGFPNNSYKMISNRKTLLEVKFRQDDLVLLQQLLHTKITPMEIVSLKIRFKFKLILSIHDFYWLNLNLVDDKKVNPHSRYLESTRILPEVKELLRVCDEVVHPSKFTFDVYSKFVSNLNFKIVSHNDAKVKSGIVNIPSIKNNTINIGFLHDFIEVKGGEYVVKLFEKYKMYRDYTIDYYVVKRNIRPYKEEEYFDFITNLNLHCLTFLSKWGETWSYSLTKALNTGLPIIYNNFGAFKERIPPSDHYFIVHENESEIENHERLYQVFENLLDYIIDNNGKTQVMNTNSDIVYNRYYIRLLGHQIE